MMFRLPAIALLLAMSLVAQATAADAPPPDFAADWILPDSLRDNGLRGDVVLNGYWRRTAGDKTSKVILPAGFGALKEGTQSLYREFDVPAAWEGRRLTLEMGKISAAAEVRVDGQAVQTIKPNKRFIEFDIPARIGLRTLEIITAGGVADDVWLRSYPVSTATIDETFIMPSFRQKRVAVRLAGTAPAAQVVQLQVNISEQPGGPAVKTLTARATAGDDGRWSIEPSTEWADARLWSRYHPNLYWYTVELTDADGKPLDKVLPRRFGFREVWIENGQFMVNGIQTNYVSDVWGYQLDRPGNTDVEVARSLMRTMKEQGSTFAHGGPRSEAGLAAAAEEGIMTFGTCGSLVRLNIWDPKNGLTAMSGDEAIEDIERNVRRLREQPSIIAWISFTGYSQAAMHPEFNGRRFEAWKYFPLNRDVNNSRFAQHQFKQVKDLMANLDPTRTVSCHNGAWTEIDITTKYLTNNLDLQEREEFMEDWFRSDFKTAISASEVGVPFPGEYFLRKIDFQLTQTKGNVWRLFNEMAARYYGEQAYGVETDAEIAAWTRTNSYAAREAVNYQRLHAEQVRNTYRAWRTYGANFVGHHILSEDSYAHGSTAKSAKREPGYPRRMGYAGAAMWSFPTPQTARILPTGETLLATIKPLLAYIGGPDGRFITKDHLYTAGAEVRKSVIVINDYDDPAEVEGEWRVVDPAGAVIAQGPVKTTIPAGKRFLTELPIAFVAPAVERRTDYSIKLSLRSNMPGTLDDAFSITVFPAERKALPQFARTIWTLNISDDLTHETPHFHINRQNQDLLKAMGVDARLIAGLREFEFINVSLEGAAAWHDKRTPITEGTPRPGDLLIIPRHTLVADVDGKQTNIRLLEQMKLDELVEQGLRVLVLEQDLPNVFGLQTEDVRPRRTFIAAKGHPVFDGIEDSDLSNWTGSSDLSPATSPISPSDNRFPERLWHTSNTNAVASRTFIRPQVGSARALVVSGFDLQESPLLEVTRGKGRIIFCQMDVTNRYGVDPVATRLLDNTLAYLLTAPEPDPTRSGIGRPSADQVTTRSNLYRAARPEGEAGWGITHGELFFRESVFNNTYGTKPNLPVPVFTQTAQAERPSVIASGPDGLFQLSVDESLMETGWAKRKIAWIRSALIVNQGGSTTHGPGIRHHGRITDLYPIEWVEGFVHPYNANIW